MNKQEIERQQHQDALDIQSVMNMEAGRRLMHRILERAGIFRSSAGGAGYRTNETFFQEGARNEGLKLMADLSLHAPIMYGKMLEEARTRDERNS